MRFINVIVKVLKQAISLFVNDLSFKIKRALINQIRNLIKCSFETTNSH